MFNLYVAGVFENEDRMKQCYLCFLLVWLINAA